MNFDLWIFFWRHEKTSRAFIRIALWCHFFFMNSTKTPKWTGCTLCMLLLLLFCICMSGAFNRIMRWQPNLFVALVKKSEGFEKARTEKKENRKYDALIHAILVLSSIHYKRLGCYILGKMIEDGKCETVVCHRRLYLSMDGTHLGSIKDGQTGKRNEMGKHAIVCTCIYRRKYTPTPTPHTHKHKTWCHWK